MIFGIQMYHDEMQVKFEYGCDPIIIEGVIALGLRKLPENEFPFIFSLIIRLLRSIRSRPEITYVNQHKSTKTI
jgi:hypothetical protein